MFGCGMVVDNFTVLCARAGCTPASNGSSRHRPADEKRTFKILSYKSETTLDHAPQSAKSKEQKFFVLFFKK
jgi:hypothetical protein